MKNLVDLLLTPFIEEGKRMVKIRALSVLLQTVKGVRGLLLAGFMGLSFCLIFVGGFFIAGVRLFQLVDRGEVGWDPVFLFGLGTFLICGLILVIAFSERTWLKASGLDKKVEELTNPPDMQSPQEAGAEAEAMITHALDRMVEERVEQRLKRREAEAAAASEGVGRESLAHASQEAYEQQGKERVAGARREGKNSMKEAL